MKINPEFHSLIPPLSPEEYAGLEASILAEGCRDFLVTWNGTLLDGHNRYAICQKHDVRFQHLPIDLPDENAAKAWIIRNQFNRRNITLTTRCELAEKLAEALRPRAKENQQVRKGKQHGADKLFNIEQVKVWKDAAKEKGEANP
jgi:hypothetical protein